MQAINTVDDEKVSCIVRDLTDTDVRSRFNLNLSGSTTCETFIEEVGKQLGYKVGTFSVIYENPAVDNDEKDAQVRCTPMPTFPMLS